MFPDRGKLYAEIYPFLNMDSVVENRKIGPGRDLLHIHSWTESISWGTQISRKQVFLAFWFMENCLLGFNFWVTCVHLLLLFCWDALLVLQLLSYAEPSHLLVFTAPLLRLVDLTWKQIHVCAFFFYAYYTPFCTVYMIVKRINENPLPAIFPYVDKKICLKTVARCLKWWY